MNFLRPFSFLRKRDNILILLIFLTFFYLVHKEGLALWFLLLGLSFLIVQQSIYQPKASIKFPLKTISFFDSIALGGILAFCLLVLFVPKQDLFVSIAFYQNGNFVGADFAKFISDNISRTLFYLGVLGAFLLGPLALFVPNDWLKRLSATVVMFAVSQVLLMLIVVHGILKPFFSRSRPRHLGERLLSDPLDHWWLLGTECTRNCSMPSGEASAAFACLAAALAWNRGRLWPSLVFTLAFGGLMGAIRIISGAHFASDVVMSAVFMLPLSYLLWIVSQWCWNKARLKQFRAKSLSSTSH